MPHFEFFFLLETCKMLKLAAVQLYVQPLFLNAQFLISTDHYVSLSRGNVIFIQALKNSINGNPACYTT